MKTLFSAPNNTGEDHGFAGVKIGGEPSSVVWAKQKMELLVTNVLGRTRHVKEGTTLRKTCPVPIKSFLQITKSETFY